MKERLTLLLLALAASCATTQPGPPDVVATRVIEDIDAGNPDRAHELFARVRGDARYSEQVYPVLFDTARERYQSGNFTGAVGLLRFLAVHYPEGHAAQEALLNALFLARSQDGASSEIGAEIETVTADLRAKEAQAPWLELVAAQHAIDQKRLPDARASLERFLADWDGEPGDDELFLYVENMARYLESH